MLIIDTYIAAGGVAGIGTFAGEFIPKGTVMWVYHPKFDQAYTREELDRLPLASRKHIEVYKFLSDASGKYIVCLDGARHFNHSWEPNTYCPCTIGELTPAQRAQLTEDQWSDVDPHEKVTIALKDIQKGEEITCDYEQVSLPSSFPPSRPPPIFSRLPARPN